MSALRLWVLALVVLACAWAIPAHATTQQQAYEQCMATEPTPASGATSWEGELVCYVGPGATDASGYYYGQRPYLRYGSQHEIAANGTFWWTESCPAGTTWDDATKKCAAPFDSQACLAHNAEPGFLNVGPTTRNFSCRNVGGCEFKIVGPSVHTSFGGEDYWAGTFEFTGNPGSACDAAPEKPIEEAKGEKKEECAQAGSGQTMCLMADGRHCYSTGPGQATKVCWRPGETGEKNNGDTRQKRDPGTDPKPPTPPDNGDTLNTKGDTTVTNTTVDGRTIVTNVTNYSTGSGADAGPGEGEGGDDDDKGSASGGAGCEAPPICSGDAINCAVLEQVWRNRCSANGNKASAQGCNDGAPVAFACSGDEIMCKQALLAQEAKCRNEKRDAGILADANDAGDDDGEFSLGDLWKSGEGQQLDDGVLSFGGSAADLLPEIEFAPGQVFRATQAWVDALAIIRMLVIAGFIILAAGIAGGIG